ncbi:amidohydrolase family protein [Candidatus Bipolaricaulota bacterium]
MTKHGCRGDGSKGEHVMFAVKNVVLMDGTGRPAQPGMTVLVDGDRIRDVGGGEQVQIPDDCKIIDGTGMTLVPGLMNMHAHLGWDGVHNLQKQSMEDSPEFRGMKIARGLRDCLEAGITTVRELGVHQSNIAAKQAVQEGILAGPRLFVTGYSIMTTAGHTWWQGRQADGPYDVRKAVREQVAAGADWIKVMASGFVEYEFTREELEAAADETHMAGKKITAHATFPNSIERIVDIGFDSVEHGGEFLDKTIAKMVEKGIFLVPTFSALLIQAREGREWGIREELILRRLEVMKNPVRLQGVARAAGAGVKIACGNDSGSGTVPHYRIVEELEGYLEFDVCSSVEEAIKIATANPAELLGIEADLGTVEAGKLADLVLVDADLRDGISKLRCIKQVYKEGTLLVDDGLLTGNPSLKPGP